MRQKPNHSLLSVSQSLFPFTSFVTLVETERASITQRCNSRLISAQWKILDDSMKRSFYNFKTFFQVLLFYKENLCFGLLGHLV